MTGDYYLLRTDEQKANAAAAVSLCKVDREKPSCVLIKPYDSDRSLAQNALARMWANEISKQGGEYTPAQIHDRCKYRYGIPIMVGDEVFNKFWNRVLSTQPTYEEIVDEIMPVTPVTRLMTVPQMAQYLTDMERENGTRYKLTSPAMYGL
ncbi:MAG TPA: recombination protein NinB [Candidatus Obscuribacterales bacterium]